MAGCCRSIISLSLCFAVSTANASVDGLPPFVATHSFPTGFPIDSLAQFRYPTLEYQDLDDPALRHQAELQWKNEELKFKQFEHYLMEVALQYGMDSKDFFNTFSRVEHSCPKWDRIGFNTQILSDIFERYFVELLRRSEITGQEFNVDILIRRYPISVIKWAKESAQKKYVKEQSPYLFDINSGSAEEKARQFQKKAKLWLGLFKKKIRVSGLWNEYKVAIKRHLIEILKLHGLLSKEFQEFYAFMLNVLDRKVVDNIVYSAVICPTGRVNNAQNILCTPPLDPEEFSNCYILLANILGKEKTFRIALEGTRECLHKSKQPREDFLTIWEVLLRDCNDKEKAAIDAKLNDSLKKATADGFSAYNCYKFTPEQYLNFIDLLSERTSPKFSEKVKEEVQRRINLHTKQSEVNGTESEVQSSNVNPTLKSEVR